MFMEKINVGQAGGGKTDRASTRRGTRRRDVRGASPAPSTTEPSEGGSGSRSGNGCGVNHARVLGYRCFQVLKFIAETIERDGIAPSYNQICDACDIYSRAKVCEIVKRLEKRGLLKRAGPYKVQRNKHSRYVRQIVFGDSRQPDVPPPPPPKWPVGMLTTNQAAEVLGVQPAFLARIRLRNLGPASIKVGGRYFYNPDDLSRPEILKLAYGLRGKQMRWLMRG